MLAKRMSTDNIDPPSKSKRTVSKGKKKYKDDNDSDGEDTTSVPRSPFGNLGNLTKTTLVSDPSSAHVTNRSKYLILFS